MFMRVKGVKDIIVGEVYEYEPWFMDGRKSLQLFTHSEQAKRLVESGEWLY